MKHMKTFLVLLIMMTTLSCRDSATEKKLEIMVFSKTNGYRHESIESGISMLRDQSVRENWNVTFTEDSTHFTDKQLQKYDVVVFLNPSGDGLNEDQQVAFERYIRSGKGFVGIHSSADFEYDWKFYGELNGAHFKVHPPTQKGRVLIENTDHPAMEPFKGMESYEVTDEWYTFRENPRSKVNVLMTLDESSIAQFDNDDWRMGDHPLVWWHEYEGSRAFYSGFGHPHEAYKDPVLVEHYTKAINWAGKRY